MNFENKMMGTEEENLVHLRPTAVYGPVLLSRKKSLSRWIRMHPYIRPLDEVIYILRALMEYALSVLVGVSASHWATGGIR